MLYTQVQGHCPFDSGDDFKELLLHMGMAAILVL